MNIYNHSAGGGGGIKQKISRKGIETGIHYFFVGGGDGTGDGGSCSEWCGRGWSFKGFKHEGGGGVELEVNSNYITKWKKSM